jgi:Mechanosensitive ion channel, conserved TM helix
MENFLNLVLEPLKDLFVKFKTFVPNMLAMLLILLIGFIVARIVRLVLVKFLSAVNFDAWSDRMGFTKLMRKGDVWSKPSTVVASMVFWMLIIITLLAGLYALQINAMNQLVASVIGYIPQLFSAMMILVIGYVFSEFVSRAVLIAAANSGFHYAKLLSKAVNTLLIVLILAMVLEQLQIAPAVVLAAFSIVFGGIVVALSIAFGVGGIPAARRMIEREVIMKDKESRHDDIDPI